MKLTGKVALVTGGTRGIGAATARKLAKRGADVAILARQFNEPAKSVLDDIRSYGRKSFMIEGDMGKSEDADRAIMETANTLGGIDILIHNAGGSAPGSIIDVDTKSWYNAFDVHVHAAFHLSRAAIPYMKLGKKGAIVLISSVAGIRGCPDAVAYGVAKGALTQFARAMARDLADYNIRVNAVIPGIIDTAFHAKMTEEQKKNNLANRVPLHRFGTPEEVADVIVLMTENDFITGESYVIDGGMTMRIV
jgi:3-oxoacyl-[acyl-carrier protein] reductase